MIKKKNMKYSHNEIYEYVKSKLFENKIPLNDEIKGLKSKNKVDALDEYLKINGDRLFDLKIEIVDALILNNEILNEKKSADCEESNDKKQNKKNFLIEIKERLDSLNEILYFIVSKLIIYIKLDSSYQPIDYLKLYQNLGIKIKINEIYFPVEGKYQNYNNSERLRIYNELINHLRNIDLPLRIVYDEFVDNFNMIHTFIFLEESRAWPDKLDAIKCAITAFYCQIFLKSRYRYEINYEYVVLKYKDIFFRVQIKFKTQNQMHNLNENPADIIELYRPYIAIYSDLEHYIRIFMSAHGYLRYFPDILIKKYAEKYSNLSPGRGFVNFLKSGFRDFLVESENNVFKIDINEKSYTIYDNSPSENNKFKSFTYVIDQVVLNRFCLLMKKILYNLQKLDLKLEKYSTLELLRPYIKDYDFVLSNEPFKKSKKVEDIKFRLNFDLDENLGYYFHNTIDNMIMVKCKKPFKKLIMYYVILQTGFKYCLVI